MTHDLSDERIDNLWAMRDCLEAIRSGDILAQVRWFARALLAEVAPTVPTPEAAYEMGAKGGPVVEAERVAFEAWMRGHCWALCATWDGMGYRSDAEQGGDVDPRAMMTRRLWAAWRDRAALSPSPTSNAQEDSQ